MDHDRFVHRDTTFVGSTTVATDNSRDPEDYSSEARALNDILRWSKSRPKWQQDALRRLCINGELEPKDIHELTMLCKKRGDGSIALTAEHISHPDAITTTVNLRAIRDVENVNPIVA